MQDLKEILDLVTVDIFKTIMKDNKAILYKETKNELWYNTICHCGTSHKLCYFKDQKSFHCYTNCGQMSLINFLMKIKNFSFIESLNYLKSYVGECSDSRIGFRFPIVNDLEEKQKSERVEDTLNMMKNFHKNNNNNVFYDEKVLKIFEDKYYCKWIKEGICTKSMKKFGIKWYEKEKHIIIPHKDANGNLIGIRRRSLKPEDAKNKYMPESLGGKFFTHSLGSNLYGLYENKEAIKRKKTVILVEGEKSVLLSDTYFGEESVAVATCGFNLSKAQLDLLKDLKVKWFYIGFDKDFDVVDFTEKLEKDSELFGLTKEYLSKLNRIGRIIQPYGEARFLIDREDLLQLKDSPFDRGKDTFLQLKKNFLKYPIKQHSINSSYFSINNEENLF